MINKGITAKIGELYEQGFSIYSISAMLEIQISEVERAINNKIVALERKAEKEAAKEVKIINLFESGEAVKDIAEAVKWQIAQVKGVLENHGYETERESQFKSRNEDIFRDAETMTADELAEKYKVAKSTIYYILAKKGIKAKRKKYNSKNGDTKSEEIRADILKTDTSKKGWQIELANKHGVSRQLVSRIYGQMKKEKTE